jgi:hypothetical protein
MRDKKLFVGRKNLNSTRDQIKMEIILTVFSMTIGALITWWVSKHYYQKAGKELQTEASELKKLNTLMLRAMEKAGLAKFYRDEHGNLKGIVIELSTKIKASSQTPDIDIHIK